MDHKIEKGQPVKKTGPITVYQGIIENFVRGLLESICRRRYPAAALGLVKQASGE
jgi:hypothetical protein